MIRSPLTILFSRQNEHCGECLAEEKILFYIKLTFIFKQGKGQVQ